MPIEKDDFYPEDNIDSIEADQIEADYKAGSITFVVAVYDLRKAGYTPAQAQKMVDEWIREKHNNVPRDK